MDSNTLAVIFSGACSLAGILIANRLTNYRIEQLENKIDKYADKADKNDKEIAVQKRDLETAFKRIDELREELHK